MERKKTVSRQDCNLLVVSHLLNLKRKSGFHSNPIRNRRAEAVKLADALNSIEGVPVSDYAKELSQSWVNGELAGEQMKTTLLAFHKKIAEQEAQSDIGDPILSKSGGPA